MLWAWWRVKQHVFVPHASPPSAPLNDNLGWEHFLWRMLRLNPKIQNKNHLLHCHPQALRENWANIIGKAGKYLCLPNQMDRLPIKGSRKQCVVSFHYINILPRKCCPCMMKSEIWILFQSNIKSCKNI